MRSFPQSTLRSILIALAAVGTIAFDPGRASAEPGDLAGRVVGGEAAGARVWVVGGAWEEPEAVAETTADEQGRFAFPKLWDDARKPSPLVYVSLLARDRDGRVGWRMMVGRQVPSPVAITLREKADAHGRVLDQDGRPIAGAEVVPVIFSRSDKKGTFPNEYIRLFPEAAKEFRATTADDGSFVLKGIPEGVEVQANVAAPGLGRPRISWNATKAVTIVLDRRVGRISGRIKSADGRDLEGVASVSLRRSSVADLTSEPFGVLYFQTVKVGRDGAFRFDELPPGRYDLDVAFGPGTPFRADPVKGVEVKPGAEAAGLEVVPDRLPIITGRVLDLETGEGIAGVALQSSIVDGNNYLQVIDQAETDAKGQYRIKGRAGNVLIQPTRVPVDHLALRSDDTPRLETKADRDWPELKLPRAATLVGVVVDPESHPVAGAEVQVVVPDPANFGFSRENSRVEAGSDGRFRLVQLDPDDTMPVRARSKTATTEGAIVIRPKDQKDILTVTIDPKHTFRVRGVVKDRGGKPVRDARVMLWWGRNYVSEKTTFSGVGNVLESYSTDDSGTFASTALWPGDRYHVTIRADGFGDVDSAEVTGRAGEVKDFGTIALIGTSGHLAGRVVDTAGKPVVAATVFNRGDGPEPASTRTDAEGKFRLNGLFSGGKYAFARKDGYRFAAVRAEDDADDLTIRLLRPDDPPAPWTPGPSPTAEDQRAFAKRLLTRLWEQFGATPNKNDSFVCIQEMARIDPALALKWSASVGGRYDERVRENAAVQVADDDPEAALELLAQNGNSGQSTLQGLADRFADSDRVKALRFAEEAAVRARALEQPDRARALAQAGAVLVRLGRADAGRKLIDEAAEAAARMGTDGTQGYTRGVVAGTVAPFDPERALALLGPIKDANEHDRYAGFVAEAIAADDPARAVALADAMSANSSTPQTIKTAVAYRIAAERPDEAIKIVEGMKGYSSYKHQAEAFGWVAAVLAKRDPGRAAALIDRALAMDLDRPQEFESWTYYGGPIGSAAWVAACARKADYPDMASVIARVMATRPSSRRGDTSMQIQADTGGAAALALTDPDAARQILRDIEERSGLGPADLAKVAGDRWLLAWALVDLEHTQTLIDAELETLKGQPDIDLQRTGLFKVAGALGRPPYRREMYVRETVGANWYPGSEH